MFARIILIIVLHVICFPSSGQAIIPLYKDSIPNSIGVLPGPDKPLLTVYLPVKGKNRGTAIIIFPGGAYSFLATETEATPTAKYLADNGISVFVLKYRLPREATMRDKSMGPLMDAQQAIKIVRESAAQFQIDTNKIGVLGFSAGGHLAATLGTHYSTSYISNPEQTRLRPDFMLLIYPLISMDSSLTHMGCRTNLLGRNPTAEKITFFSGEKNVTPDTPPTYLTHAGIDGIVSVKNSMEMYESLRRNGVAAELHLFPSGEHVFVLGQPLQEWVGPILGFLKGRGFY